jgi:hypothetical protein
MTNKQEIIESLKLQFPTLRVGDEDKGYTELSSEQYEAQILEWADAKIEADLKIAEAQAKATAKTAAQAKLAALGLTVEDLQALGL